MMDVTKYPVVILESFIEVMKHLNIMEIKINQLENKANMIIDMDVTSIIGLVGDIKGNIAFSFNQELARKITSAMCNGMSVQQDNELVCSAVGEFINIVLGRAGTILSQVGIYYDVSPPSVVFGRQIFFVISSVQTMAVSMDTQYGVSEINIGIETDSKNK
ncbi:MAG: chemotaxis protein CheX [Bacillota bacterium]